MNEKNCPFPKRKRQFLYFSQSKGSRLCSPFIRARAEDYEQVLVRGVQVFPDTVTTQELQFVPLAELPGSWNRVEIFDTPPQNL